MTISMIAAFGHDQVIGNNNRMIWKLPADTAYFVRMTMGKTIVMGRSTFESFGSKPLKGRKNIILTRNPSYQPEGCVVMHNIAEVLEHYAQDAAEEWMIIGGSEIYRQFLPHADKLYLTHIDQSFAGDSFFPPFAPDEWEAIEIVQGVVDEKNVYTHKFVVYKRVFK